MDPKAFDASMTSLHNLNLADNGLQALPAQLVPWTRLKSLDLSGNPWYCDSCALSFLPKVLNILSQNKSNQIVPGRCASPEPVRGQSLLKVHLECTTEELMHLQNKDQVISAKDEVLLRHEATNATAVIVSVSIVSTVVILTIVMFIYLKWCKSHVQDWIKEYKWRRHDARLAQKTSTSTTSTTYQYPYLKGDNYIYTSPRLHHTYVYHGQSPLHSAAGQQYYTTSPHTTSNATTTTDNDDEYFYVSNHHYGGQDTAVVMNNYATATVAKHIPVTVL